MTPELQQILGWVLAFLVSILSGMIAWLAKTITSKVNEMSSNSKALRVTIDNLYEKAEVGDRKSDEDRKQITEIHSKVNLLEEREKNNTESFKEFKEFHKEINNKHNSLELKVLNHEQIIQQIQKTI